MKYIFDFDDVLFDTASFKEHFYSYAEKLGISYEVARDYYLKIRGGEFSLRQYFSDLFTQNGLKDQDPEEAYRKVMADLPKFLNNELVEFIRKVGKQNCFLVTYGELEFHTDKIENSGIKDLFKEIYIVPGSKKEIIYNICAENKDEKVFFIDDKQKFFDDLDPSKCPNLKTILYTGQDLSVI